MTGFHFVPDPKKGTHIGSLDVNKVREWFHDKRRDRQLQKNVDTNARKGAVVTSSSASQVYVAAQRKKTQAGTKTNVTGGVSGTPTLSSWNRLWTL